MILLRSEMTTSLKNDSLVLDWTYRFTRWTLGGLFIYAGSIKLWNPETFAVLMDAFGILPAPILLSVAITLPVLEVVAGLGLLCDVKGSLAVIAVLLVLFIVVLAYGVRMGLDIDCGCFGPEDPESKAFHGLRSSLYRDLTMLLGVSFIYGLRRYLFIKPVRVKVLFHKIFAKRRSKNARA